MFPIAIFALAPLAACSQQPSRPLGDTITALTYTELTAAESYAQIMSLIDDVEQVVPGTWERSVNSPSVCERGNGPTVDGVRWIGMNKLARTEQPAESGTPPTTQTSPPTTTPAAVAPSTAPTAQNLNELVARSWQSHPEITVRELTFRTPHAISASGPNGLYLEFFITEKQVAVLVFSSGCSTGTLSQARSIQLKAAAPGENPE